MTDLLANPGQHPATVRLGWTLLHFLWQGSLVAAGLAVSLWFLRDARTRYLAGCVALVLLALLPLATWTTLPGAEPSVMSPSVPPPNTALGPISKSATTEGEEQAVVSTPSLSSKIETARRHATRYVDLSLPILIACWMAGVLAMTIRLVLGSLYLERIRYLAREVEPQWQARLAAIAQRLKISRTVRLLQSGLVEGATQIGWLRPVVLVPAGMLTNLTAIELDGLLAHELAHVRRHDYLVTVLQGVVEACLFYHPAVWWVSGVIRAEREHCCDDVAVDVCGSADHYLAALTAALQLRVAPTPLGLSATGGALGRRIERIYHRARSPVHVPSALASRAGLMTVGLVLVSLSAVAWQSSRLARRSSESTYPLRDVRDTSDLNVRPAPPVIPLGSLEPCDDSVDLRELRLERHGHCLIRSRIRQGEPFQEFRIRLAAPGPVVVQVIPQTAGFTPSLVALWPSGHEGEETDSDLASGRGQRPQFVIDNRLPSPNNWIRVQVWTEGGGRLVGDSADYMVYVRQPRFSIKDWDADTLGAEASPIVLDVSGYGRPDLGKNPTALPTLEYCHDVDTFQFRSTSHAALTVAVDGTVGELNPYVELYDAERRLIAAGPSGGGERVVTLSIKEPTPDGLYYLAVASYDQTTTGVYMVQVRQRPRDS